LFASRSRSSEGLFCASKRFFSARLLISGIQILKWCWVLQQQRVSKILECENSLGITIVAHQDIQLLAKLAEVIMGHQAESSETQWKEPHEQTREIDKLGPSTQKVSKLNPCDQKLWRQAATIVTDEIRENIGALDELRRLRMRIP